MTDGSAAWARGVAPLIARALVEGIPLVGVEVAFDHYGVSRIWQRLGQSATKTTFLNEPRPISAIQATARTEGKGTIVKIDAPP